MMNRFNSNLSFASLIAGSLMVTACTQPENHHDATSSTQSNIEMTEATPLQSQLDDKKAQWAANANETTARIYDEGIQEVADSGVLVNMLQVGDTAPDFMLPGADGQDISLSGLLEKGPVILVFYRGEWCPYCNLTLAEWQSHLEEIETLNATLVAISPQLPDFSLLTKEQQNLAFPVLSDVGNLVADAFGITTQVTPEILEIWKGRIDLEAHNGDGSGKLPLPATYIIRPDRTIAFADAHADYRVRAEPDVAIEVLR